VKEKKIEIKGCTFRSCLTVSGNGGAIYVEINSDLGNFAVLNSDSTGTKFISCSSNLDTGKGGGIYLKLGNGITSGFSFNGELSFNISFEKNY
jgi:hypothetical protein